MNLFIDTNIYLTFYHFTSEDLEELRKLLVVLGVGDMVLFLPEQVKWEYTRNRESKIADALKRFSTMKLPDQFPQICKQYSQFQDLQELIKEYEKLRSKLITHVENDVNNKTLLADGIIKELFEKANTIKVTDEILTDARTRLDVGNPPGKKGDPCGDAINWEILLKEVPEREDLYLITDDRDYLSQVNDNNIAQFLLEEWQKRKKSNIFFYKRLSAFFKDRFPDIKLASELEKELAILNLITSPSFESTHLAIVKLSKFTDFSNTQINEIVEASISNSQIYWINDDEDVKNFLCNIINGRESVIDSRNLTIFKQIYLGDTTTELQDIEELPF